MNINLFKLALEHLAPSDWEHFEKLCSSFLVSEFSDLRTMASSSGDGGRDSELYSPTGNPFIGAQYSVTVDWKSKIKRTVARLASEFPDIHILIFMSNQTIGAKADDIKKEMLDQKISVDVRDKNWFLERAISDVIREAAAEELIDKIARPYLRGEQIIPKGATSLTSSESRSALLYLGLQLQDDQTEKGLTKISFDALVRAALRHSSSEDRIPRQKIHDSVLTMLPHSDGKVIMGLTDAALERLSKRYIRHWQQEDSFCLTYDEHERMAAQLADVDSQTVVFMSTVTNLINDFFTNGHTFPEADIKALPERVSRVIQKLFLRNGELFIEALQSGTLSRIGLKDLEDIILHDLIEFPNLSTLLPHIPRIICSVVKELLVQADETTLRYLRRIGNSYTLFTFLNHTPDIQSATRKLFSHGTIWVDTSILLPLFAEFLDESKKNSNLSTIFTICHEIGIELRVTNGVIQEVEAHMSNALNCSQYTGSTWRGRVPYLYNQYITLGNSPLTFKQSLERFRGYARPQDDLFQFLSDNFGFQLIDLDEPAMSLPEDLRFAVDRLWSEAHKKRRHTEDTDNPTTDILIKHDIETYLGVVALRQKESVSELGYRHWLLTLDTVAWEIRDALKKEHFKDAPTSPLLSLSFLTNSMAIGPHRSRISKDGLLTLPIILDVEMAESMPIDILANAEKVRQTHSGRPEYVIRRMVRDAIDAARRRRTFGINAVPNETNP